MSARLQAERLKKKRHSSNFGRITLFLATGYAGTTMVTKNVRFHVHIRRPTLTSGCPTAQMSGIGAPRTGFCSLGAVSMSAALRGASDEDFERSAQWLADMIRGYLFPKTSVRFLRRVVEIIQARPGHHESQAMCEGFCAHPNCHKVCARASDSHRHCRCFQHQMENMRDRHCNR